MFRPLFHRSIIVSYNRSRIRSCSQNKRPSFFGNFIQNFKQEYAQDRKIQENLKKFREEAQKLEESDALKEARQKFEKIETELWSSTAASALKEKWKNGGKAAEKFGKIGESVAKSAERAAESIGDTLSKSEAFKTASDTASILKREIEGHSLGGKVYVRPLKLRKRHVVSSVNSSDIRADDITTGVELHKDSKFYANWQKFKENNPVFTKFVEAKMKYEESDNPMIRGTRFVTDKLHDFLGSLFTKTELSEALTEIVKMDPNFCREQFLKDCERDIIPNILEAINRGDLEILKDWCFEAPYTILSDPIRRAKELGYQMESTVLDIDGIDLTTGMVMEQGPVLAVTFNAQQIMVVRDQNGVIIEGHPDQVLRIMYIFVLCRDQTELDPKAAWRLLEVQARDRQEQYL